MHGEYNIKYGCLVFILQRLVVTLCTTKFNIQQFYVLSTECICVSFMVVRTNRDYFPIQHWLFGFYKPHGMCLLLGTDWIFK